MATVSHEQKLEYARSLKYFHEYKGDMTRYVNFEEAIECFPSIKRALEDYNYAKSVLDHMVENETTKLLEAED